MSVTCHCCGGKGVVQTATGELRPCSRCRDEEFLEWSRNRALERKGGQP